MSESRKLLPSEKTRLKDVVLPGGRILGHGAQLQAKRPAEKQAALRGR